MVAPAAARRPLCARITAATFRNGCVSHGAAVPSLRDAAVPHEEDPWASGRSTTARWWILGTLVLSLLVVVLDNTILNVALKTIQQDLGATQSELAWAVNAYTLVFAGLLFTYGVLGDRYGRRLALVVGLVLFGCASALSRVRLHARSSSSPAGRSWASAARPSCRRRCRSSATSSSRRARKAIGIWAGFVGVAIAVGPITGGLLLEHFWWGSVFLVNVPVVLVALVGHPLDRPGEQGPAPAGLDPLGVVLSIVGLVLLVYGIIKGGETTEWGSAVVLGPLLGGVAVLARVRAAAAPQPRRRCSTSRCSATRPSRPPAAPSRW